MKRLSFIFIISLLFTSLYVVGQTTQIDSLENLIGIHTQNDTIKVDLLNEIVYELYLVDNDRALEYAKKAKKLSEKLSYKKGKAESLLQIGEFYFYNSDNSKALEYYLKALEIFQKTNNKFNISKCLNYIGIAYRKQGDYIQTIEYYQKALEIREYIKDKKGISNCLNNIGVVYDDLGNYPKALDYYQRSLIIDQELEDKHGISGSLNNIGVIYESQKDYFRALEFYNKSLKISLELDDKTGISICFNNIGSVYANQENYSKALEYYYKSLDIDEKLKDQVGISIGLHCIGGIYIKQGLFLLALKKLGNAVKIKEKIGDNLGLCETYSDIGMVYLKTKNYKKALNYTEKSLEIAKKLNLLNEHKNIRKQLYEIYVAIENYKKALENYVLYKSLNDSIFNKENIRKIAILEYSIEYEKEKLDIKLEQQKKDAVITEEIKLHKIIRNVFIVGSVLLLLLVVIVYRSLRLKRRTNDILSKQKNELEILNKTKNKFFSIIAHDLRSPFNAILGFSELLLKKHKQYDDEEREKYLEYLHESSKNTYELVENLFTWAISQSSIIKFTPENLDIKTIVSLAISKNEGAANRKDIKLVNNIVDEIIISADKNMLNTVLRNLISNSVKFTHKNGKVTVSYKLNNKLGFVEISVTDTGIGMSDEQMKSLFVINEKESYQGTDNEQGSGLGLILCKEFVEKHKGEIWAESTIGKGSIFHFTLPLERDN